MRKKGDLPLTTEETSRVKTYAAMGLSYRQIGRELKRSDHTIKKLLSTPAVAAEVRSKKAELSDMFERLAIRTIEAVSADDIKNASLQQKAVSSGIFIDKMQLLRDQPTANINVSALLEVADLLRDRENEAQAQRWRATHALPPAGDLQ